MSEGRTQFAHLLRWHRAESDGGGLSVVYALRKSEKAKVKLVKYFIYSFYQN